MLEETQTPPSRITIARRVSNESSSLSTSSAPLKKRALIEMMSYDSNHSESTTTGNCQKSLTESLAKPTVDNPSVPSMNLMVDHTYVDYSIISEKTLSLLDDESKIESISELKKLRENAGEDQKLHEERNQKWSQLVDMFVENGPIRKNSGGVVQPFPEKLLEVLNRGDMNDIITWMPHGRAFIVRQPKIFAAEVLPRFFKQSKFMSFTRQLNLWGFKRITKGPDQGSYYHQLFLRGRNRLQTLMRRQKIKGTGIKLTPNPDQEPNFYKLAKKRPLPELTKDASKPPPPLPPKIRDVNLDSSVSSFAAQRQHNFSNSQLFAMDLSSLNTASSGGLAGRLQQLQQQAQLQKELQQQSLLQQLMKQEQQNTLKSLLQQKQQQQQQQQSQNALLAQAGLLGSSSLASSLSSSAQNNVAQQLVASLGVNSNADQQQPVVDNNTNSTLRILQGLRQQQQQRAALAALQGLFR